jgi:hypothetical protein
MTVSFSWKDEYLSSNEYKKKERKKERKKGDSDAIEMSVYQMK